MKPDICVFAGRFRPFHAGHYHVVKAALDAAQYVFVIVGSINEPINFRNPFTFAEVREQIRASLKPEEADRVFILGIEDHDSDVRWVSAVQAAVSKQTSQLHLGGNPSISLIGYSKDESSYYLKLFPQWSSIEVKDGNPNIDATAIRYQLYESGDIPFANLQYLQGQKLIPDGTFYFLREWIYSPTFHRLRDEYLFMRDYLLQFPKNPYTGDPQQFVTADACVIQGGSVLLVRRDQKPGEGLWALPGGHKRAFQTFFDAALDELCQETGIDREVPREMLKVCTRGQKVLDNPWRSTRSVTISIAFGLFLPGTTQPKVEGMDDARCARWWPIDEVTREMMFEDHFNVIEHFANQFRDL